MTTENQLKNTAQQPTGMMAKNRTGETTKRQNNIETDRADAVAEKSTDIKAEKKKGSLEEREIVQAAQEKAKEEEEKLSGLWEIRARFKNLAEKVLPKNPYLMGIPNKIHITTHEGLDWRRGTPFSPHEERVQYVSFQRLDDDETVLRPQPWDEENAKSSQSGSTRRTSSDFSSVPGHTPRKKMSMEEYLRRKNPDSGSANASQEGSLAPQKADSQISREANVDPKIKPKISPSEATGSKMEGKAMQEGAPGSKPQETAGVASAAREEITAEKKGAVKSEGSSQRETMKPKEVATPKEVFPLQREDLTQKVSVVPKESHTGIAIARGKEDAMEKRGRPSQEGMLPGRKR